MDDSVELHPAGIVSSDYTNHNESKKHICLKIKGGCFNVLR